ncbi:MULTISPECIES: SsgA family sporulation/cell division regulator [Amycolatopsis]|uniref:SsgA family sporulation/cell division regulator n=1 Tax=Amycolatopsis TaxID=1813 RepID=UPI000B8A69BF|nr:MULTISPECIES: SsgA family sporulation/cell division regulator [Amycolatopsis]OXM70739.1 SsgA family sporulation/cell division regulator [Amycolatopsis sp. KNN50.9b]
MIPQSLTVPVWAELLDTSGEVIELAPLKVVVRYRADDPYAIGLDFEVGSDVWVCWLLARDLLARGLALEPLSGDQVGDGDVVISPARDVPWRVWIELRSPSGAGRYAFKRDTLAEILAKTEALVPPGTESGRIDWDRELTALGGEAA